MSIEFKDRVSSYPNRYRLITESGGSSYVTLERADEPTFLGTPLNAENLNQLANKDEVSETIASLPDMYLWEKYDGEPGKYTTETIDTLSICQVDIPSTVTSPEEIAAIAYPAIYYGDSFTFSGGLFTLVNPVMFVPTAENLSTLSGKYVQTSLSSISCYYIPKSSSVTEQINIIGSDMYKYIQALSVMKYNRNSRIGYVMSKSLSEYEEGTQNADGYWYVYAKRWGDCAGNLSDEQLSDAIGKYFEENSLGAVTITEVNEAIDTAFTEFMEDMQPTMEALATKEYVKEYVNSYIEEALGGDY